LDRGLDAGIGYGVGGHAAFSVWPRVDLRERGRRSKIKLVATY
jgi:hypothetical protein